MSRTVVITGAAGNIGRKLSTHMTGLGWRLRRLDIASADGVQTADLLAAEGAWKTALAGAETVIHLAAHPWPPNSWTEARENIDMTANVLRAAREGGVRRVVFASSNWVMAGYRFADGPLTPELAPLPINPYGASKLVGERLGRDAAAQGLSFIALRIGWNQPSPGNLPGPHMAMGTWGQQMWLSDRDLCQGFERAVVAEGIDFAVLNLMSDNPGMRWDLEPTRRLLGYAPQDGWTAVVDAQMAAQEEMARRSRDLAAALEDNVMRSGW